jgi:hypothetical protein
MLMIGTNNTGPTDNAGIGAAFLHERRYFPRACVPGRQPASAGERVREAGRCREDRLAELMK